MSPLCQIRSLRAPRGFAGESFYGSVFHQASFRSLQGIFTERGSSACPAVVTWPSSMAYTLVLGRPPAEADLQRFFQVTPPSVHQMVLTLERSGLIRRQPGMARSIKVPVDPEALPPLRASHDQLVKPAFPVCGRPPPRKVFCSALIRSLAPICPACLRART
jgi:hypothetical protein